MTPHWAIEYVGGEYVKDRYECSDLVMEVLRRHFDLIVSLPRASSVREADRMIVSLAGELADETAEPQEGDAVLLIRAGRRGVIGRHIGVYCFPNREGHVLHNEAGLGVSLDPIREIGRRGFQVFSYHRFKRASAE